MAIEDNHEGVSLTIFPTKEKEQNGEASDQLVFKNHHLSHECGPNLERCQDPLVEYYINSTDKSKHSIIFIPLDGGLALVDVARSDYPLGGTVIQHFIFLTNGEPVEISCSPSAVFKIIDGFYVVCTNWTTNFVSIFEIYLNKTSLKSTQFSFPLNELTVPASLGNITNATNFIHIEYLSYHYIVFALGTAFYSLRPFFYAENRLGDVQSKYCDAVHLLVQKEGVEFWAYCSDYVYSYDVGEGDWNTRYALAERGITYQCSQARVKVSVFSDHANIGRGGSDDSVNMRGSDFVNGVCFGNGSRDFFAYVDELAGVYVMDVETTEMRAIYELGCNDRCLPPIVVNSSYLIIRGVGERKVSVLDFFRNPPELLEAVNTLPVLVSMLFLPCPPETIPVLAPPIDVEGMDPSKLSKPRVIGGVVGSVMFILVVVSVVVAAVVGVLRWRKWKKYVCFLFIAHN